MRVALYLIDRLGRAPTFTESVADTHAHSAREGEGLRPGLRHGGTEVTADARHVRYPVRMRAVRLLLT
jgi:hypothetical protein